MAKTSACSSIHKNNGEENFEVSGRGLAWATEKSLFTIEQKDEKILTSCDLFQWQGNDTGTRAHWLTKLNGKTLLKVNFPLVCFGT